jgi:Mg-chelatase subunit ChlD
MAGAKWFQAIKLASAMAAVSKKIRTIDLVISFRASDELVKVLIAFDSRTDDLTKVTSLFPHLGVGGGTPEGLSFQAIKEIINTSDFGIKKRKYFINISDGQPAYAGGQMTTQYSGEPAWAHTRRQINSFKDDGMTILSYYVEEGGWGSHDQLAFRTMYGPDAQFINISSLTDIARTLNQMMLRGEANLDK